MQFLFEQRVTGGARENADLFPEAFGEWEEESENEEENGQR